MYIGIVFILLWVWVLWEIITAPLMPDEWENEPTDIDDKYDNWWPDRDIE